MHVKEEDKVCSQIFHTHTYMCGENAAGAFLFVRDAPFGQQYDHRGVSVETHMVAIQAATRVNIR